MPHHDWPCVTLKGAGGCGSIEVPHYPLPLGIASLIGGLCLWQLHPVTDCEAVAGPYAALCVPGHFVLSSFGPVPPLALHHQDISFVVAFHMWASLSGCMISHAWRMHDDQLLACNHACSSPHAGRTLVAI